MTSPRQQRALTWRVLCIFAISAPINCYFLIQMEVVRYTFPTWVVPLSNVIFTLTAVMLINAITRLLSIDFALKQGELLLLYVTLSVATSLAGCDVLQAILSVLGHSFWFATEENEWRTLFGITSRNGSLFRIEMHSVGTISENRVCIVRITYKFGYRWWARGCCCLQ